MRLGKIVKIVLLAAILAFGAACGDSDDSGNPKKTNAANNNTANNNTANNNSGSAEAACDAVAIAVSNNCPKRDPAEFECASSAKELEGLGCGREGVAFYNCMNNSIDSINCVGEVNGSEVCPAESRALLTCVKP